MLDSRFEAALRDLTGRGVRFVLVGGMAGLLHGAPLITFDLDVVYSRDPENLDRLLEFLAGADAIFRQQRERRFRPNRSHLEGRGHLTLLTKYGPVDVLADIGTAPFDYDALLPRSHAVDLGECVQVQVLDLEAIIESKEQAGRDKDLAGLPLLRETLRLSREGRPTES